VIDKIIWTILGVIIFFAAVGGIGHRHAVTNVPPPIPQRHANHTTPKACIPPPGDKICLNH